MQLKSLLRSLALPSNFSKSNEPLQLLLERFFNALHAPAAPLQPKSSDSENVCHSTIFKYQ